ncbi:MAG: hypothetical protein GX893_06155 [Firmicutes bacterium]|nr:hypothetical protein [Bacillota bacterium]
MDKTVLIKKEKIAVAGVTFLVRVQFTENKTWQGTAKWLEGRKTKHYCSLLELIMLIQDAIAQNQSEVKF